MKNTIFFLFTFTSLIGFCQRENKLSFEFGTGINSFDMSKLNRFYVDEFAVKNGLLTKKINSGFDYFLQLKYQTTKFINFGVYGNYQIGTSIGNPLLNDFDNDGNVINSYQGNFILKAESISFGIVNCIYIHHFLNWEEKKSKFLNKLKVATEINLGIGCAKASTLLNFPTLIGSFPSTSFYRSNDFQGKLLIRFEYELFNSKLISSLGCKFGYQYYQTKNLTDLNNNVWLVEGVNPINLNFSGLSSSFFINIGK